MTIEYSKDGVIGSITIQNPSNSADRCPEYFGCNELSRFLSDPLLKGVLVQCKRKKFGFGSDYREDIWEDQVYRNKENNTIIKEYCSYLRTIFFAHIPIAAIIRGDCLNDGLGLALACHFRFASVTARFGFPDLYHCSIAQWDKFNIPFDILRRQDIVSLLLSGELIGSIEAQKLGLIDFINESNSLHNRAKKYLKTLTKNRSPELIRTIMKSIHNCARYSKKEVLNRESRLFDSLIRRL